MTAEEKAMELYPVKNQHVPTIGGRTAYIDVNEKARNAFLKGYEYANQQPEVETQDKVREAAERLVDVYEWDDWNDDIIILISPIVDLKNVLQNIKDSNQNKDE
jgi:hypothetical protein